MKLLIVGGVAGGATSAARARRIDEHSEIIMFERGEFISFANCGLPYYIGGEIKKRDNLLLTTPDDFRSRYRIDVRTFSEVIDIDLKKKEVTVKDLKSGSTYKETYDRMILSPGAEPLRPPIEGIDLEHIYQLRNIPDTDRIKAFVDSGKVKSAVIVGGGFIGLEMAESLASREVRVTIVEMLNQVMAPLDYEMAAMVQDHLKEKGVRLMLANGVTRFSRHGDGLAVSTTNGEEISCDMVLLSAGVKPESMLAKKSGLELNDRGGIVVNDSLQTSDPFIYATGDAVEIKDFVTGFKTMVPLAGPANKQGRIAADNVMGRQSVFRGVLGTAVVKVFGLTVASTGQSEKNLKRNSIPHLKSHTFSNSHASYYPGAEFMGIKLLFSPGNGKVLGAQIVGGKGVDKRIDVLATAIKGGMTVYDLEELELAYAPPYSSAKDPVNMAGFVASNILKHDVDVIHFDEVKEGLGENDVLLDLRTRIEIKKEGTIDGAIHIPVDDLRANIHTLDPEKTYVLFCAIGMRGYIASRILSQHGFNVKNLSGGYEIYKLAK
ncbi:MAG: FAD-dependent oxidoreductase [Proteobacteria bacterium]|nr:FAD-dependent oxidoreductase [Pseudomonadota bacterium]